MNGDPQPWNILWLDWALQHLNNVRVLALPKQCDDDVASIIGINCPRYYKASVQFTVYTVVCSVLVLIVAIFWTVFLDLDPHGSSLWEASTEVKKQKQNRSLKWRHFVFFYSRDFCNICERIARHFLPPGFGSKWSLMWTRILITMYADPQCWCGHRTVYLLTSGTCCRESHTVCLMHKEG